LSHLRRTVKVMPTPYATASAAVDRALAAGKFGAGRRDHYLNAFMSDPKGTQALLDVLWSPNATYQATVEATRTAYAGADIGRGSFASQAAVADPTPPERIRQKVPAGTWDDIVRGNGAPPTAFPEGDAPAVTASGVGWGQISFLPWRARIAAAYAPTTAEVRQIIDKCSGEDAVLSSLDYETHPAVLSWEGRVYAWARYVAPERQPATPAEAAALVEDLWGVASPSPTRTTPKWG
jgi:hypothetical protein